MGNCNLSPVFGSRVGTHRSGMIHRRVLNSRVLMIPVITFHGYLVQGHFIMTFNFHSTCSLQRLPLPYMLGCTSINLTSNLVCPSISLYP